MPGTTMTSEKTRPVAGQKFRLITRSDMDGLICAIILKELGLVDEVTFAHPKDMQDGKVAVTDRDISTNLPYVDGVHLCFDHHASEALRNADKPEKHIIHPEAPSAARVVFDHYGGRKNSELARISDEMLVAVDKADSAAFSRDDILNPEGWDLLSFLMDPRTGLGRFRQFRVSNYELMMKLIEYCRDHTIAEILALPDVKERVDLYKEHKIKCRTQVERCARIQKNLIILDLRHEDTIWAANRFLVYALFPQCNVSIHVLWGKGEQNTVFATGKSILNRTSRTNVGELMLHYGGGGHEAAGTCQVDNADAPRVLEELTAKLTSDG